MNEIFCPPYEIVAELIPGHLYKGIAPDSGEVVSVRVVNVGIWPKIDAALIARLQTWVDMMVTLSHPNIARLLDVKHGESEVFIISEWCEGHSLRALMESQEALVHPMGIHYLQQVGAGLDYLHSKGICHRDFTLQRVLVDPGGMAKIIDVALLGVLSDLDKQGGLEGSERGYVSPQELLGQGPSREADLFRFSVGCFELLSGNLPFSGDTPAELRETILSRSRVLPDAQRRSLPRHLVKFFENALSVEVKNRPTTASQIIKPLAKTSTQHQALGAINNEFPPFGGRSGLLRSVPRWLVLVTSAATLGIAVLSTHFGQLLTPNTESLQTPHNSATRLNPPVGVGTQEAVASRTSSDISPQLLSIAQRRTGGEKEIFPILREMIEFPPSTPVRPPEQQLLKNLLEHDNPALRHFVIRIIERRNIPTLNDALIDRLYDGDPTVRATTVKALQAMAVPVPIKIIALRAAAESVPSVHAKLLEFGEGLAAESKMGKGSGQ